MADYDLGTARGRIEIDSSGAEQGAQRAGQALGGIGKQGDAAANSLLQVGTGLATVSVAAVAGLGIAVNAAANFEKSISAVGAVSNATEGELEKVRKKALQLGADTKFSAGESAQAMEELVKAGLTVEEVLNGAADATVALAAAGEIDLPQAATISANAMNQFNLAASDLPHVADLIAGAANASAIDVSEFGQSMQQAGATANLVGLSFDDLTLGIAAMGNAGIKGSDAGTSLKTFLANLQPVTAKQTELMKELGIVTEDGANQFFTQEGKIKSLSEIAGVLSNSLAGMTDQQKSLALETIFGSDAIRAAAVIAGEGSAGFDALATSIGKISAEDVAAKRMDNLAGSLEQLKGSIETALIGFGSALAPVVRSVADFLTKLTNAFSNLSPGMKTFIVGGIAAVAVLAALGAGFTLAVGGALKFVKAFRDFQKAMKFLKGLQAFQKTMALLNTTFLANPVVLIVAALIALGVAIFIAYKKIKPFRDAVDATWQAIQKAWDVILGFGREVLGFFSRNWKKIALLILAPIAPILLLVAAFFKFKDTIFNIIGSVIDFFKKLPGRIIGFVDKMVEAVVGFFQKLPGRVASFVAEMVSKVVEFFASLPGKVLGALGAFIETVVGFFLQLPAKIGFALGFAIGTFIKWQIQMVQKAIEFGTKFLAAIVSFFTQLPGRILGFLTAAATNTAGWVTSMIAKAVDLGTRFISTIANFFTSLPSKIIGWLRAALGAVTGFVSQFGEAADACVRAILNAFRKLITGLPGIIKDAVTGAVKAIAGAAGSLAGAAAKGAGGLISGAKKALFGSPHTKIEYWIWDMLDNVEKSVGNLAGHFATMSDLRNSFGNFNATMEVARGTNAVPMPTMAPAATAPGGPTVNFAPTINNPVGETSEESLFKTGTELAYLGAFG